MRRNLESKEPEVILIQRADSKQWGRPFRFLFPVLAFFFRFSIHATSTAQQYLVAWLMTEKRRRLH